MRKRKKVGEEKREKERGDSHRPRGRGVGWDAELKGSEERRGGWSGSQGLPGP